MIPFIKLDTPTYKNIPDKSETQGFENYMEQRVNMMEAIGGCHIGQKYFPRKDPDDLAQVFEEALADCCAKRTKLTSHYTREQTVSPTGEVLDENYEVEQSYEDARREMEDEISHEMGVVIREHLKRTNGNIGHFPYSGERIIKRFVDDETKREYLIHLDPLSIYWADAIRYAVDETANLNSAPAKETQPKTRTPSPRKHLTVFLVSTLIFLVSALVVYIKNRFFPSASLMFLGLFGNLLSVSAIISFFSLLLLLRDVVGHFKSSSYSFDEFDRDRSGFRTHHAQIGFGMTMRFETYDKNRFEREVKELHEYYQFLQLWAENAGRELPARVDLSKINFYQKIKPFILTSHNAAEPLKNQ